MSDPRPGASRIGAAFSLEAVGAGVLFRGAIGAEAISALAGDPAMLLSPAASGAAAAAAPIAVAEKGFAATIFGGGDRSTSTRRFDSSRNPVPKNAKIVTMPAIPSPLKHIRALIPNRSAAACGEADKTGGNKSPGDDISLTSDRISRSVISQPLDQPKPRRLNWLAYNRYRLACEDNRRG